MEGKKGPGRPDKIQELIFKEKEAAETSFEAARFDARLFERIRSAAEPRTAIWLGLLRKPGPVMAISSLVLAVAGLLLLREPSASPIQQTVRAISAVLDDAGAGRKMKGDDSAAQQIVAVEYTDFGWALKGVLYACERQSLEDIDLAESLSRIFLEGPSLPAASRGEGKTRLPDVESFKLKTAEDYRVFFTRFLRKFEEA